MAILRANPSKDHVNESESDEATWLTRCDQFAGRDVAHTSTPKTNVPDLLPLEADVAPEWDTRW